MSAPDFTSQTAEPMTEVEMFAWFHDRYVEGRDRGATFQRFASREDKGQPDLHLYEGWIVRPDETPDPAFGMVYA